MITKYLMVDNFAATLAAGVDDDDSELTLSSTEGLPDPAIEGGVEEVLLLAVQDQLDSTKVEIVRVWNASANPVGVQRGYAGTTPLSFATGARVEFRLNATIMAWLRDGLIDANAFISRFDAGGDARGEGAMDFQSGRDSDDQVASGYRALAVGYASKASGSGAVGVGMGASAEGFESVAFGVGASAVEGSDLALGNWATAAGGSSLAAGDDATTTDYGATALGRGATAGGADATAVGATATTTGPLATAVGNGALAHNNGTAVGWGAEAGGISGAPASAAGYMAKATGVLSAAFGFMAQAFGMNTLVLGQGTATADSATAINSQGAFDPASRTPLGGLSVNSNKARAFAFARHVGGLEHVGRHDVAYASALDASGRAVSRAINKHLFYSPPIQIGDAAWQATHTYTHGQAVLPSTPNGRSYVAMIPDGVDFYTSGESGAAEPTWPTTAEATVVDGDITWLCVNLSALFEPLPDHARVTPTAVGVIALDCTLGGSATDPSLSFGSSADPDLHLASTTFTLLTGDNSSQFFAPTNTEGVKTLGAALTAAGTDLDCTAVVVVEGVVIESAVA